MAQRETWAPRNRVAIGYLVSSVAVNLPTIGFTAAQLAGAFSVIVLTDPISEISHHGQHADGNLRSQDQGGQDHHLL